MLYELTWHEELSQPSTSADNAILVLDSSRYQAQPYSVIVYCTTRLYYVH